MLLPPGASSTLLLMLRWSLVLRGERETIESIHDLIDIVILCNVRFTFNAHIAQ